MIECKKSIQAHDDRVWCVCWSPNGELLASCSSDSTVKIWNSKGELLSTLDEQHNRTIRRISFSPDGKYFACASFDSTISVYEVNKAQFDWIATLEGHENEVKGVAFSSSGKLATCSRDKSVWVWEMDEDEEFHVVAVLQEHTQDVKALVWHPSYDILFSVSYDNSIKVWMEDEDEDWYCHQTLEAHPSTVWDVCVCADGSRVLSVGDNGAVRLYEFNETKHRLTLLHSEDNVHSRSIYACSWCEWDPTLVLTSGGDNKICLLRITEDGFKLEKSFDGHSVDANAVAWNPKHKMFASGSDEGEIRLWSYQ